MEPQMDSMDLVLSRIYFNPEDPSSFGSVKKLFSAAKKKIPSLVLDDVKDWLSAQNTYTLHRSVKRKFEHSPTYADHVDSVWQLDTADVKHMSNHNNGIKYLLILIDVLSRFAFVVPLRTKEAKRVAESLTEIEARYNRRPRVVVSDPGLEFRGSFTKFLKREGITQYLLRVEQKAPLAERFIRTLKEKMVKYMTLNGTKNYLPAIGDLVRGYNNAVHSRIKKKPIDVTPENENEVKETLYGRFSDYQFPEQKFNEGDMVRQVKKLKAFDKGTTQTTTDEVFIVDKSDFSRPPRILYHLKDLAGDYIKGRFYEEELIKVKTVTDPREYMLPGKQRVKMTKRKTQTFKTYKGWPRKFDIKLS